MNLKQKRSFHTILSGLKLSKYGNRPVRFLTLTTSSLMAQSYDFNQGILNSHFQILRKRILRYSPYRLYREGYITKDEMTYYYGHSDLFKKFSFEYFKVETNEGHGVLHIVYRGSYLPHSWISSVWFEIHNSPIVNIKLLNYRDMIKTSCYIVSQYISSQKASYVRSSQSWNWVFRGFKGVWYALKRGVKARCFYEPVNRKYFYRHHLVDVNRIAIFEWDNILKDLVESKFYPQSFLLDFG